jgi:3-hydroxyacyl-CoA dehydrogenase / enoyl-CoA hydratase / 3-hydroxybutyryl-CoA epimerase
VFERLTGRYDEIRQSEGEEAATRALAEDAGRLSRAFRALETCGKPVAAAINGTALGGGFELCLACHYRVVADDGEAKLGLPEARLGLLPGAGGTQRLPRLIGAKEALPLMLRGRQVDPAEALKLGIVDKLVPADRVLEEATDWVLNRANPVQPWDEKSFRLPGGAVYSGQGLQMWSAANALYRKETFDNYDAQRAIMKCVYEGLTAKTIDAGLAVENRYLVSLLRGPQAANMIRTLFFSMQALGKGARRPPSEPHSTVKKLGVLGAGFMGAGIAHVSARAGIEVVLIDRDSDSAERGKAHAAALMDREIEKGRAGTADKQAVLDRIVATVDYDRLERCDLVIEAVFEDRDLKAEVLPRAERQLHPAPSWPPTPRPCRSPGWRCRWPALTTSSASTFSRPSTGCSWSRSSWDAKPAMPPWPRPSTMSARSARRRSWSTIPAASSPRVSS